MSHSQVVSVPGRVNLIGEHIDYHQLPVLPMAIQRRISLRFQPRTDSLIRAASQDRELRAFRLEEREAFPPGDWGNYLKAAVQMIDRRWQVSRGVDVSITTDLSPAAGLSSSSALLTGFALALLRANGIYPTVYELMELLPEGEQFVGTRGGGMDHAAVLASRSGSALLVQFDPFAFQSIPIPRGWAFLVAHSLTLAEKSGPVKAEYNARRTAGLSALRKLNLPSFRAALELHSFERLAADAAYLTKDERDTFLHVVSEARRVESAVTALRQDDIDTFGRILSTSHASLRDQLRVSHPSLDELVASAMRSGALGARLTGAGFGGCAIIVCQMADREDVYHRLIADFYATRSDFVPAEHLLFAEPSDGALSV